jgi:FkbM family methyltransferase
VGQGLWLKLRPRTGQSYLDGIIEPDVQKVLADCIRPGMVFYDLGANLGFFSLIAARLVGETGKVLSFEADPEVAQRLMENVRRNGFRNVRLMNHAVWSSTGSVMFARDCENVSPERGGGKVVPSAECSARNIEVPCIALDEFVHTEAPPDFIKCDVEGAECEVLMGAREMLAAHRPPVACEVHSDKNAEKLAKFFADLNYTLNWFTPGYFLARSQNNSWTPNASIAQAGRQ